MRDVCSANTIPRFEDTCSDTTGQCLRPWFARQSDKDTTLMKVLLHDTTDQHPKVK